MHKSREDSRGYLGWSILERHHLEVHMNGRIENVGHFANGFELDTIANGCIIFYDFGRNVFGLGSLYF